MHRHSAWVEVNINNLKHNFAEVRRTVGQSVKIMAVVKADAYGHGLVQTARAFVDAGADYLGVTTLEEGLTLRDAGLSVPVLVFSPLLPDQMEVAVRSELDQTLSDFRMAEFLSKICKSIQKVGRVHVKVDTGMGRLGILPEECVGLLHDLLSLGAIHPVGVYTHFANSSAADPSEAIEQNRRFSKMLDELEVKGISTKLRHAANSGGILNMTNCRYDMVRPGTILYGQFPAKHMEGMLDLKSTWCLKTRIVALKKLPAGAKVGYGGDFVTSRPTLTAVIPVGYSDGLTLMPASIAQRAYHPMRVLGRRLLGSNGQNCVTVRGKRVPIIGRVSMQMTSIDVTDVPDVEIGDEVIISSRRTTTSSRIPRIYLELD